MNVYVISVPTKDRCKIGITRNLKSRLSSLQTGSPWRLTVEHLVATGCEKIARSVEHSAHRKLADKALIGEWFNVKPATAASLIDQIYKNTTSGPAPMLPVKPVDEEKKKLSPLDFSHFRADAFARSKIMVREVQPTSNKIRVVCKCGHWRMILRPQKSCKFRCTKCSNAIDFVATNSQ